MSKPQITFLARHYPPERNINGESICDMAEYLLKEHGIESTIICTDRPSPGGGNSRKPTGNVIKIKTRFKSKKPIPRFFAFLYDGYSLVKKSREFKDTVIICTTSPPMLPFWASRRYKKGYHWGIWMLDLFPEGFAATGTIKSSNFIYKWVRKVTYRNKPDFLITLGPKQHEHLEKEYNESIPSEVLPCGVFFYQEKSEEIPSWYEEGKIFIGYCGNIAGAHNENLIRAAIDEIDPAKYSLVLALYGNKAPELKKYAEGKPGIFLVDSVPRNQLHFIDIHLVTLKTSWTHIAVPSKAVSAISMGGAIIFCGDESSDNWHMFKENGWLVKEDQDIYAQTGEILEKITLNDLEQKRSTTDERYEYLKSCVLKSYENIAQRTINNQNQK